jgi:hypothetical protein
MFDWLTDGMERRPMPAPGKEDETWPLPGPDLK